MRGRYLCVLPLSTIWILLFLSKSHGLSHYYRQSNIDYSAVNEYIEAHYGTVDYFEPSAAEGEPIYNARNGVFWSGEWKKAILDECGFELCRLPSKETGIKEAMSRTKAKTASNPSSLNNGGAIQQSKHHENYHLPELRILLEHAFGPSLERVVFWHPMVRGTNIEMDRSADQRSAPPAALVHIDTDIGAYDMEDLTQLIQKNSIKGDTVDDSNDEEAGNWAESVRSGKRFVIVNAWRNIHPTAEPVRRAPLALCLPIYQSPHNYFPRSQAESYKWYTFPEMTTEEVLLFKQYDRRVDRVSDLWHCALLDVADSKQGGVHRKSLDLRALCILDEELSDDLDRYGEQRQRALLSLQESECFCHEQGLQRQ